MKPSDRPSMNRVVEMLEGEVECLQMPSKPFLSSSPKRPVGDVGDNSNPTSSSIQSGESSQSVDLQRKANIRAEWGQLVFSYLIAQ